MNVAEKVRSLGLPKAEYAIMGGAAMALLGLRQTNDIDALITPQLYGQLKSKGWIETSHAYGSGVLTHDCFEFGDTWIGSKRFSDVEQGVLGRAYEISGVMSISLDDLIDWKRKKGREKDLKDIEMIEKYLSRS